MREGAGGPVFSGLCFALVLGFSDRFNAVLAFGWIAADSAVGSAFA
jgi:hypothetical protein